jgi:hypothetical protein
VLIFQFREQTLKLLESYRPAPGETPKHRFIKQWTVRKGDLRLWGKQSFLDNVELDLEYLDLPKGEQKKALAAVRKAVSGAEKERW